MEENLDYNVEIFEVKFINEVLLCELELIEE